MVLNIFFMVAMYPILLIMYFVMKQAASQQGNIIYGCSTTKEFREQYQKELAKIDTGYKRYMKQITIVCAMLPWITFAIPYMSISFTVWMTWLVVVCFIFAFPYVKANRETISLKEDYRNKKNKELDTELHQKNSMKIELGVAMNSVKVKVYHFLPQLVISILAVAVSFVWKNNNFYEMSIILTITFAICNLLFWTLAMWMDHQKCEVISTNSAVNLNYSRAKRNVWKNFWMASAWINTIYVVCILVMMRQWNDTGMLFLVLTVMETLVILVAGIIAFRKGTRIRETYTDKMDETVLSDDDANWIWGMFYYNKQDPHSMVEKRFGIGTTMNMAKPAGKILTGIGIFALAIIPITCVWMISVEFTPIELTLNDDALVASQIRTDYNIPLEKINNAELIDELPESLTKVAGTAMDNLDKGTFENRKYGKVELFLNPNNEKFLRFDVDGKTYFMSGYDDEQTTLVYYSLAP